MENAARFWNRIAVSYSKKPVTDEAVYQQKLAKTREYFHSDMEVVEFGCGTGSTALVHAPFVKHIRAADISEKMIGIAQRKADNQFIKNVTFECSTIEELTVPNESVDAVLALSILHLLEDKEAVMAKVHDMLRPGGIFVTSTVCIGDFFTPMKWIAPIGYFVGALPLLKVFGKQELEDSLEAAGFEIDYLWQPSESKSKGVFIIARKPAFANQA